jgi:hypothetical protein
VTDAVRQYIAIPYVAKQNRPVVIRPQKIEESIDAGL